MIDFQQIVENANDVILVTDSLLELPGPRITYVNSAFERLTGYTSDEVLGKTPRLLQGPDTSPKTTSAIKDALIRAHPIKISIQNYTKDNRPYWAELSIIPLFGKDGSVEHFAAIQREITAQKAYEAELLEISHRDPLTGAYNRRFSDSVMSQWFKRPSGKSRKSILMLDIDNFKSVNDRYGHPAGDKYLAEAVRSVQKFLRSSDAICRTGGEEFLVLLPDTDLSDAEQIASRVRQAIEDMAVKSDDHLIQTTVSVGLTMIREGDTEIKQVLDRADSALYTAKHSGKNKVVLNP
jgi:diguanylate cyclase (GGDEF)-like protein/PAS domain S-box-containing protein